MGKQLLRIVKEICTEEKINIRTYSNNYIMQLEANKRVMYIFGNKFPNNNATAEQICDDKSALSCILKQYKIPHIEHYYFDSPIQDKYCPPEGIWGTLRSMLKKYNQLVCKTNRGSGGHNVYKVSNQRELESAVLEIFKISRSMSVSPYYNINHEYRVIIANGDFCYAFEKIKPYVVGDGIHNLSFLINSSCCNDKLILSDGLDLNIIPKKSEKFELSWKHNLGQGATPKLVEDECLKFKLSELAKKCVSLLDLGFVSVDIVDVDNELKILEVNSGVMIEHFSAYSIDYYNLAKKAVRFAIRNYLHLDTKYYLTRKRKSHFVLPVLTKIAKKKKIQIIEDKEEKNFAIFGFPNGKYFVARDYPFNINDGGAIALCSNKNACNSFIKAMGFNTPKEKYYVRKTNIQTSLNEIEKDLQNVFFTLGFTYPIVVKPNNLSQGEGVYIVNNKEECIRFSQEAFLKSHIILLQEYCIGNEYRIVVLNNKIIQAYQRVAFQIKGDGTKSVEQLINEKIDGFKKYGRDKEIDLNDNRIMQHINKSGYSLESVLSKDEVLKLQDIANLSLGGESIDVLNIMDVQFQKMAISLSKTFNLRLCGIDIIASDISSFDKGYYILEINSSPGLDNYMYEKNKQEKYVQTLYTQVLDTLMN